MILNLLLIVLGFGVLIFIHELGHFVAAKWAGIRTEVFAIGMGTPVVSWRKGIGFALGSTHNKMVAKTGKAARDLSLNELADRGIGCTEYSLRWLPIGGFVKMLGQDDADPGYVSNEPGSYNVCPVGKRMVVVSAGVVSNILLAVALFVVAFMVGVQSPKPIVGGVDERMPAATVMPRQAAARGISGPGLKPGDVVLAIDGDPVSTFVDIRIAVAMARPDVSLSVTVDRPGTGELIFDVTPRKDAEGLLGLGIAPGHSTRLLADDNDGTLDELLAKLGLAQAGVRPRMKMISAAGRPISTYEEFEALVEPFGGKPVPTVWTGLDRQDVAQGPEIQCDVPSKPALEALAYPAPIPGVDEAYEAGLIGLTPLVRIARVVAGSANAGVLEPGDLILRAGAVDGPRVAQFKEQLANHRGSEVNLLVLREGQEKQLTARVDRKGHLNVNVELALDLPLIAEPMERLRLPEGDGGRQEPAPSPVAALMLMGRTRIDRVNDTPVTDWTTLWEALRSNTRAAWGGGDHPQDAMLTLTATYPTPGRETETLMLTLPAGAVARLHRLPWLSELPGLVFEPSYVTLSAGGNPLEAAAMGFRETWKVIVMTYLTIDRLVRGSVGVEQIRGPVGIVHIGTQIADRGVTYLVFFLGIISVNLAVINFLPIPIVDGGLFLFLIYEKLKGRPPPLAFQNAATIAGVALIATALLVVTWNDLMRLVG